MTWRVLIQGFRLFDKAETPLRIEFRQRSVAAETEWLPLFRKHRYFWMDLFFSPESVTRLLINNLTNEFLQRDLVASKVPNINSVAFFQLKRFIQIQAEKYSEAQKIIESTAEHAISKDYEMQFRITTISETQFSLPEISTAPFFGEVLFVSEWMPRSRT